ncbi:unnamed protein product [Prunus armeniaca]|uniref:Uncharacterized protein n=1 Tax=Prunus armeniaca TaxID=36596 RepID=A0A6J5XLM3_PRUAR|nr:unnamed protein product [Prunus armeniaca]
MSLPFFHSLLRALTSRWPVFLYAATWTLFLTVTVAVASFSPEIAFVTAISPSSPFSKSCAGEGFVRIPLDYPREAMCFPANMVRRSNLDFFVPTVFAALIVAGSAFVVRSLALWEGTERRRENPTMINWNLKMHMGWHHIGKVGQTLPLPLQVHPGLIHVGDNLKATQYNTLISLPSE